MKTEIPVLYDLNTCLHHPNYEVFNGEKKPHPDNPSRVISTLQALRDSQIAQVITPSREEDVLPHLQKVHTSDYLEYLIATSIYAAKIAVTKDQSDFEVFPTIHPYANYARPGNRVSRRGYYVYDTYTPITKATFDSASASARLSIAGADLLKDGQPTVYCLTRPSGHHALSSRTGGMCYLNNAAVAAEYLTNHRQRKVGVLDIDLHHGNGTQDIFYGTNQVVVVNIHCDPNFCFPHFSGHPEEIGAGEGTRANLNLPLPENTGNLLYDDALQKALIALRKERLDYLVVSAGFDTHEKDPLGKFKLTTTFFQDIGRAIRGLDLPTLVVQEGGYSPDYLGLNVVAFLKGLIRD